MSVDIETLRGEIKAWEKAFADTHNGKRPSRNDVKRDETIAAKYNHYNVLSGRKVSRNAVETPTKQRKHQPIQDDREALRERNTNTTKSTSKKDIIPFDTQQPHRLSPVKEEEPEPTPAFIRHALGPTPQKDGQILGIFDIPNSVTPSRRTVSDTPSKSHNVSLVAGTPSKSPPIPLNLSRTPQSTGKRFYLDAFAGTPLKRKRGEEDEHSTPGTAKRQFTTPSFLRRSFPLAPMEEEPGALRQPLRKRGMVRSLSSMIQNMRKQEEGRLDEEQDIMDEIEAEARGESAPSRTLREAFVADAAEMPLGPDQGPQESEEEGNDPGALDANGNPRKVWKKKGLKRQTRRSNMRPVLHKPRREAEEVGIADADSEDEGREGVVQETQRAELRPRGNKKQMVTEGEGLDGEGSDGEEEEGSDYANEELPTGAELAAHVVKGKAANSKATEPAAKKKGKGEDRKEKSETKDGTVKKAARKVSAQAHQNFRRLKIRQKNPKSGGKGGRFAKR